MKERLSFRMFAVFLSCGILSGCGVLCQAGSMTCGMSREEAEKVLHPKAYGEYWTQAGIAKESWRADWVTCGGLRDGSYVAGARLPGEKDDFAASRRKTRELDACMQAKGYHFNRAK